ncbi:hypothetical protein A2U01_0091017, partial [Trifolium medium]|nr:hypothetical protein [Trifolium medium]
LVHCEPGISQMGPESSNFASDRSMLEESTQYLFNDSQFPQPLMNNSQPLMNNMSCQE